MGAVRPRVAVSLRPDVYEVVQRLAAVQGRSLSAVVGEVVEEMSPGLAKLAELGEALESMTEAQRDSMRRAVAAMDEELAVPAADAFRYVEMASAAIEEVVSEARASHDLTPPR